MDFDSTSDAADLLAAQERREPKKQRIIGHLVSLTGMHGADRLRNDAGRGRRPLVRRQFDFRGARQLAACRRRLRTRDVQQPMARERKQSRADQDRTQRRNHRRGAGETSIPPRHSFLSDARLDRASHPRLRPAGDLLHTWGPRRGNRPAHSERNDTGDRKRQGTGHPAFRGGRFHRRRQDDGGFHAAEDSACANAPICA